MHRFHSSLQGNGRARERRELQARFEELLSLLEIDQYEQVDYEDLTPEDQEAVDALNLEEIVRTQIVDGHEVDPALTVIRCKRTFFARTKDDPSKEFTEAERRELDDSFVARLANLEQQDFPEAERERRRKLLAKQKQKDLKQGPRRLPAPTDRTQMPWPIAWERSVWTLRGPDRLELSFGSPFSWKQTLWNESGKAVVKVERWLVGPDDLLPFHFNALESVPLVVPLFYWYLDRGVGVKDAPRPND